MKQLLHSYPHYLINSRFKRKTLISWNCHLQNLSGIIENICSKKESTTQLFCKLFHLNINGHSRKSEQKKSNFRVGSSYPKFFRFIRTIGHKTHIVKNLKLKTMKITILKISVFVLLFSLMGAGCDDNEPDPQCYQGKVVSLNQGSGCQNIIEIVKTIKDGELAVGTTISFNPELYGATLKVGDIVYFKVLEYEEFGNPISTQPCTFPQFAALIEFCNN